MMGIYRVLLLLYPAAFRAEYGSELSSLFARRLRDCASPFEVVLLWMEAVADVGLTAAQTHWDILSQDLHYTLRTLRRSPGFTTTAIVVAALGIGATTAAYTITDHVLLRPLPFPESNRIVKLWEDMSPGNYKEMEPSPANYRDWKQMSKSFSAMAASRGISVGLVGSGEPVQVEGAAVTADLLPMLGAQPILGRIFTSSDDKPGAAGTVILGYGIWVERFASDPAVLGKRILLDGAPFVVIGVMNRDFGYQLHGTQIWTAMRFTNDDFSDRNNNYLHVLAKLAPRVSIEQARSEMRMISERLRREYPKDNQHVGVTINRLRDEISERSRLMLMALLGASFCVLLIACTNLANILLARALVRRKELDLRKALGAGRERLVRQILTESLLLALAGGVAGVVLAAGAVPLFSKLVPDSMPIAGAPSIDSRVLIFALLITTLTGICFGVIPSARVAGDASTSGLQEGARQGFGGRNQHIRSILVVAEVAICFTLLICSGLLIRALLQLERVNPGFRPENVLTMRTALAMPKYESTARRTQFYTRVLSKIRQVPGVTSAGYTSFLPVVLKGGIWPVTVAGQEKNSDRAFHVASLRFITPGYFETMNVPLLRGRTVSESDTDKTQFVAVVSESFVRQYWPGQDPLGRQFDFGLAMRRVVGVVRDVRVRGLERSSEPQVYLPYKQVPDGALEWYAPKDLAVRYRAESVDLFPIVRRIIAEADPEEPISDVQTLEHVLETDTAPRLLQARVLGGFACIAFVLAGFGIHGLLSFAVSNRLQEIGVRIALGARSGDILGMVLREGALLAVVGTLLGIAFAYGAGRTLESLLAGIRADDLPTYTAGIALVLGMTVAGCFWPAFRALRVDPMTALRAE
jgi:predicted permease